MNYFFQTIADLVAIIFVVLTATVIIMFSILFPIAWFDGHAKSAILKQQGIELPWYQSTFLEVNVNNQVGKIYIEVNK